MFKSYNHILTVLIVDGAHIHLWKTEHRDRCLSSSNFQSTRAPPPNLSQYTAVQYS